MDGNLIYIIQWNEYFLSAPGHQNEHPPTFYRVSQDVDCDVDWDVDWMLTDVD